MRLLPLLGILLLLSVPVAAQDEEPIGIDIETIDPFSPEAGDFLDLDLNAIRTLAWEAYQDEDYETAARYYLAFLQHDTGNAQEAYNLACCYALLDKSELAIQFAKHSIDAGFEEIWQFHEDPDFASLQENEQFTEMLESAAAEIEEREAELGNVIYFETTMYLRGRIRFPDDFDPMKSYRLIVGVHGFGSNPDRFIKLWERFSQQDFIYVSPCGPYPFMSGLNEPGYSWGSWIAGEGLPQNSWMMSEEYIASVVEKMRMMYKIDKAYLLGFSQGAYMAYTAGVRHHQLLDGFMAFGGWLSEEDLTTAELEAGKHLDVFIAHGSEDLVCDIEGSLKAQSMLQDAGYEVSFHEFEGAHRVPEEVVHVVENWLTEIEQENETED